MIDLKAIATQLKSPLARDRLQALNQLKTVPAEAAVPLVKTVLRDPHVPVRSLAIMTLAQNPSPDSYEILRALMEQDEDYSTRAEAAAALGTLADPRAFQPLVRAFLEDESWLVQYSAVVSLGNLKQIQAQDTLRQALDCPEPMIQMAVIAALGEIGDLGAVERLLEFAAAEDWLIRERLAYALGTLPTPKSQAALRYLQKDSHRQVAQTAAYALSQYPPE